MFNLFTPTPEQVIEREIAQKRLELIEAERTLMYYTSHVKYLKDRIAHLEGSATVNQSEGLGLITSKSDTSEIFCMPTPVAA